jgi:hypothetical protein
MIHSRQLRQTFEEIQHIERMFIAVGYSELKRIYPDFQDYKNSPYLPKRRFRIYKCIGNLFD